MEKRDYIIACTAGCDLDRQLLKDNNIVCINFIYLLNGVEYEDDYFNSYNEKKFYEDIKKGGTIKTSQIGYGRYEEFFESYIKQGKDILFIGLSGGITGDTATAQSVARELNEKYTNNKIYVIDSTCASSGYGILVLKAVHNRNNNMSIEDNVNYLEKYKYTVHHWFISSDLSFYVKGGRLSGVEGFIGTALKICPILFVDYDGRLTPFEKIRTKIRALENQVDKMEKYCVNGLDYDDVCYISNSDCYEDANLLASMIKDRFKKLKEVKIFSIGSSIGAHTGPNTVSLYFIGTNRSEIIKED